jgi:hypothetical protein
VEENLTILFPILPHALQLLQNVPEASQSKSHQFSTKQEVKDPVQDVGHGHHHHHHQHGSHSRPFKKESPWPMVPIPEALEIVLKNAEVLSTETVDLDNSLGTILSQDVESPEPFPPFRASMKDGYAVIAEVPLRHIISIVNRMALVNLKLLR